MTRYHHRLVVDEDSNSRAFIGALRREIHSHCEHCTIDAVVIGESGAPPPGTSDEDLIHWAEREGRVIVTHYKSTLCVRHRQIVATRQTPGIILISRQYADPTLCAQQIVLYCACVSPEEHAATTEVFVPLPS